jgi:hypothetical protein
MDLLATLAVIVAGVLIYRAYKFLTIHPYKAEYEKICGELIPFAKKFGFEENDVIAKEDVDFRYKHLKALIELEHTSGFRDMKQLNTFYDTISRMSKEYEDARKAFKTVREKY